MYLDVEGFLSLAFLFLSFSLVRKSSFTGIGKKHNSFSCSPFLSCYTNTLHTVSNAIIHQQKSRLGTSKEEKMHNFLYRCVCGGKKLEHLHHHEEDFCSNPK